MSATKVLKAMAILAVFAATAAAQIKNVAVVESEIDAASGASADITSADVRQVTSALRREAVKNLPPDKYNIMTSETVLSQGSAVLEECADENCVITLGAKIGADYIVRGIVSKLRTRFTLSVEVYETDNGNLVASSSAVRSENVEDLVDKAAAVCAEMFEKFVSTESSRRKSAEMYAVVVRANPPKGGSVVRDPDLDEYRQGSAVKVTAKPAEGYVFTGWAGAVTDTAGTVTVKMDDNKMLVANFKSSAKSAVLQGYALVTSAYPPEGGSVTRSPDKEEGYAPGERVAVTAAAEHGYKFAGWSAASHGGKSKLKHTRDGGLMVTMDGDKAVAANFNRITFDFYFEPKYQFGLGTLPNTWGGVDVEFGWAWGAGAFFGFGATYGGGDYDDYADHRGTGVLGGGCLSIGNAYELVSKAQIVYGVSVGFWYVEESGYDTAYTVHNYYYDGYGQQYDIPQIYEERIAGEVSFNFLAPFVKLRHGIFEFTYRGLLGYKYSPIYDYSAGYVNYINIERKFGWNQHQLMIGFYLSGSKRWRPKL